MKKIQILGLSILAILFITMTSCDKEDEETGAVAKITVLESGVTKSGIVVYMFSDREGPSSSFFTPFHSDKSVVTDDNGIATFELQEIYDLDAIDSQTTIYFGVFSGDNNIGYTAMTIKKGDNKSGTINVR